MRGFYNAVDGPPRGRPGKRPLHRIVEVMARESMSLRTMARRFGVPVSEVARRLRPDYEMTLAELYHWRAELDVPVAELLSAPPAGLSSDLAGNAALVRAMRTAKSLSQTASTEQTRRLAARLIEQLAEAAPGLAELPGWPSVGQPRRRDEPSAIEANELPASQFDL